MLKQSSKKQNRYQGMTRRKYKQKKAGEGTNSEPGRNKGPNCQATQLEKALTKYPRSHKTMSVAYFAMNLKRDLFNRRNSFFTRNK